VSRARVDSAVRGGIVVTEDGLAPRDVLVSEGRIAAVLEPGAGSAEEEIDARGLHVLPGAVDVHVHFNEPGRTEWEGWERGTRGAAAGGVTTVVDMPLNSIPPTTTLAAFDAKRAAAEPAALVDFALWGGLVGADERPGDGLELRCLPQSVVPGVRQRDPLRGGPGGAGHAALRR
jgi:allantoinase